LSLLSILILFTIGNFVFYLFILPLIFNSNSLFLILSKVDLSDKYTLLENKGFCRYR